MKRNDMLYITAGTGACVFLLVIIGWMEALGITNTKQAVALERYTIASGTNIGRVRGTALYLKIEADTGVPADMLAAGGIQENLGCLFEFGVKRIPLGMMRAYPIDEWQARAAARIYTQEAFNYILEDPIRMADYFQKVGERYCKGNKRHGASLKQIYKEVSK